MIENYIGIAPKGDLQLLRKLGDLLGGRFFLNLVDEHESRSLLGSLKAITALFSALGIDARLKTMKSDHSYYKIAKKFNDLLRGRHERIASDMWAYYLEVNRKNSANINAGTDVVFVHNCGPIPAIEFRETGRWIWCCHTDICNPSTEISNRFVHLCRKYDAALYSGGKLESAFWREFLVPPSIDPLNQRNKEVSEQESLKVLSDNGIPAERPSILQVCRFDHTKGPMDLIRAYRLIKKYHDCILVIAGEVSDMAAAGIVLNEIRNYSSDDPDIYILGLPPESDLTINSLQRSASIVVQDSADEGFGVFVLEALWKGKPVVCNSERGAPIQLIHSLNGFVVQSPEGVAFRLKQLLNDPKTARTMGLSGKEHARRNFLITRQARDYLSIWYGLEKGGEAILALSS